MSREEIILDLVNKWLKKADKDLLSAEREMSFKDPVTETVCFHCQQAVEKYLKAFLIYHQIYFKKTHQISELIELCSTLDPSFRTHLIEADDLSDYAVDVRYPDIGFEPDIKETKLALEISYKVQKFVLSKLNL